MKLVSGETYKKVTRRRALAIFVSSTTVASAAVLAACGASSSSSSASSASASSTVAKASSLSSPSSTSTSSTAAAASNSGTSQFVSANPTAAAQAAQAFIKKGPQSNQKAVEYWHSWSGQWENVVDRIVAWFNVTHPAYFVKPLVIPTGFHKKFLSAIAGGSPPDIVSDISDTVPIAAWSDLGAIQPLDDLVGRNKAAFKQWFWPICWDIGTYKGHLWGTASTMDSWALMYNEGLFVKAGLDPNKPPTSIEELDTYAAKLFKMQSNGQIDVAGFIPSNIWQWANTFGGDFFDEAKEQPTINAPRNIDALTWMTGYSKRYGTQKIAQFQSGISATIKGYSPFAAGKYAMALNGEWVNLDMKHYGPSIKYGVVTAPYPPGGRPNASWVGGNYQLIPKGAKEVPGAFSFLEWWSGYGSPEALATICHWGGWIPCGPEIVKQKPYQDYLKEYPYFKTYIDVFHSPNVTRAPKTPVEAYMIDQVNTAQTYALDLKKTPEEALSQAQELVVNQLKIWHEQHKS